MTDNRMPTTARPNAESAKSEQATQPAPQDRATLPDAQMQLSQSDSPTKRAAPGRMPLFRR